MLEKEIHAFKQFLKEYDINESGIRLKEDHTYRVMNFSIEIARSINLNEEDIRLAGLIGLLHDIGRFEQLKVYKTFDDSKSVDHAQLGIDIIEKFPIYNSEEDIILIKKAIFYHNKFEIGKELSEREILFAKIIRDADKLDIINLYLSEELRIVNTNEYINDDVYNAFLNKKHINHLQVKSKIDHYILILALIFDYNFEYSLDYAKVNKTHIRLIDKIIEYNDHDNKLLDLKDVVYSI
jgi:putative nucleotidyltransferase with HDIG domain